MFKTGHTSVNRFMAFWEIEGLWQLCIQQIYQYHFSNSVCSLHVSVSHPGNSLAPSNFLMLFYVLQWSVVLDVTAATCWRIRWWVVFFSNKVFLIKACTYFRHNAITHFIYWETKKFTWLAFLRSLLYWGSLEVNPQCLWGWPVCIHLNNQAATPCPVPSFILCPKSCQALALGSPFLLPCFTAIATVSKGCSS